MTAPPSTPSRLDSAEAARLLASRDIAPTRQRVQVAAVLLARDQHLSAAALLERVNREGEPVSKATVYNTLALFLRKGLVREVVVDRARVFYDSNTADHHHLYDTDRCTLTDIDVDQISVSGLPALPEGTMVDNVDVIIRVRRGRT
jgi:Fur family iron response transcriptional regulator